VNAGNQDQDFSTFARHNRAGARIENPVSAIRSLPFRARRLWESCQRFTKVPLDPSSIYHFASGT